MRFFCVNSQKMAAQLCEPVCFHKSMCVCARACAEGGACMCAGPSERPRVHAGKTDRCTQAHTLSTDRDHLIPQALVHFHHSVSLALSAPEGGGKEGGRRSSPLRLGVAVATHKSLWFPPRQPHGRAALLTQHLCRQYFVQCSKLLTRTGTQQPWSSTKFPTLVGDLKVD